MDQVVVIDGGERVIWNCVERYRTRLACGKLRYCVGNSAVLIVLEKLKRLVIQPTQTSKDNRKAHKMNAKNVKEGRNASSL